MAPRTVRAELLPKVLGVLVSNHLLILLGAAVLVVARQRADGEWAAVGVTLLVVGIGIEAAVIAWSASLVRRAASARRRSPEPLPGSTVRGDKALCVSCGWSGSRVPWGLCPRCQRTTVRV